MKRRKNRWLVWAALAGVPWLLFEAVAYFGSPIRRETCLNQVRREAYAALLYGQDWDETYPQSWTSAARCPEARFRPASGDSYALSPALAGKKWLRDGPAVPLLFEVAPDGSFARRHGGQGTIAWSDGHAASLEKLP